MKYHDCSKYHHMIDIGGNSGEFVLLIFERGPIETGETPLPYSSRQFLMFSHFYRSSKIYEKILEGIGYQDIITRNIDLGWPFFWFRQEKFERF